MLPNAIPPHKDWYHNRCEALAKVASKPETFPPFLIASYCQSVLKQIYGSAWRVVWMLFCDRIEHEWDHVKTECWWSWHMYVRLRTHDEIMELWSVWLEKETGIDDREWPDEIEIEAEQPST